jgi:hypothetical protein
MHYFTEPGADPSSRICRSALFYYGLFAQFAKCHFPGDCLHVGVRGAECERAEGIALTCVSTTKKTQLTEVHNSDTMKK